MVRLLILCALLSVGVYSYSASLISAGRQIFEAIPFPKAARAVFEQVHELIEPTKIKFPETRLKDALRSSLREGVSAVASAGSTRALANATPETHELSINTNVDNPDIKIMNIGPKYRDGIELTPGDYDILVEKNGYRSSRFWVEIEDSKTKGSKVALDVVLDPLGLPGCTDKLIIGNHAGAFYGDGGNIVQYQVMFENVDMNDLYQSYANTAKATEYYYVYDTVVFSDYVEFHIASPTSLSKSDITENLTINVDMDRFIVNKVIFEQQGSNVLFTTQMFMPPGVAITDVDKGFICENVFTF
ncbi:hypothetical protein [Marinobacter halophilus]|uniref:PEGA domain-containing protein n=1 Tax=Marinobacter halophilus TaxID=1323740 RepID=A0A2T1KD40_9GAMM|nr:hypothetical protein [Marinobacter halophilus]PSF08059.1 hypothetical protein C7H08_11740 [Marinobacter halophilus]GGC59430.1 hypothetical protein GCM10011362_04780 [Marinobacter halophilus]